MVEPPPLKYSERKCGMGNGFPSGGQGAANVTAVGGNGPPTEDAGGRDVEGIGEIDLGSGRL